MRLLLPLKNQAQKPQMKNKEICITIDSELFVSLFVRIVLTVYTTIVIELVQEGLPSLIIKSFEKFDDMIIENNSFLKDGSLVNISDHMYQLVYDWTYNYVLGVVQRKLELFNPYKNVTHLCVQLSIIT